MADQVLKLTEIEDFFGEITSKMLKIDLNKKKNLGKVRIAWPTSGAPTWKINDDVVFLRITPVDDVMARQLDICYDPVKDNKPYMKKKTGYTRVHKVNWTFYGPMSYDNADIVRHSIFDFDYMTEFKKKNLFLITDVSMPVRLPELYNDQWWERTDFSATFNEGVVRETEVPYLTSTDIRLIPNR